MKAGVKKFYLFGENIETSLSPFIHSLLFKTKQRNNFEYFRAPSATPPDLTKMNE